MAAFQNERGSIAVVILSIAIILGVIGLAFYALTSQNPKSTDTISANCDKLSLAKGDSHTTAGTTYWHATITNNSDYICRLTGYPAAFMSDSTTLSIGATSNSLYSPTAIAMSANGGQAHAVLGLPPAGSATCTTGSSSVLRLFIPGLLTPLTTDFGEQACPGFTVTALQAGP